MKNNRRPKPGSSSSSRSVWPGILAGVVLGLGVALGVFYLVSKNPPNFDNLTSQQHQQPKKPAEPPKPEELKPMGDAPSNQQRYDYYRILSGNGDTLPASASSAKPAEQKAKTIDVVAPASGANGKPANGNRPVFLQVGSFANADEADNLKAKVAMLGLDVEIQTTQIEDVGVRHRVRVGPLRGPDEIQQARSLLSQNGLETVLNKN